eukprot:g7965.t1
MGKKKRGKRKSSEASKPAKPVPSPRLSADAAEWHPPSFVAATARADIVGQQPEPISVAEIDVNQDKPPELSAAPQPSTNSVTPPSTPGHGEAVKEDKEEEDQEEEEEVREPRTIAAIVPDDPASGSQEPPAAASPVAVASSEPVQEGVSPEEPKQGTPEVEAAASSEPMLEVESPAEEKECSKAKAATAAAAEGGEETATPAAAASRAAAAEEAGAVVATTGAVAAASEVHGESLDDPARPPAVALPEALSAKLEGCVGGGGDEAAEAFAGLEGKAAGGKAEATAEAEDAEEDCARGQGATDVTSDPTDDNGSDPDLSCVDLGDGKDKDNGGSTPGGEDRREREEGGGFFANPALLRWGGAVALVGALLVVGLRRGK